MQIGSRVKDVAAASGPCLSAAARCPVLWCIALLASLACGGAEPPPHVVIVSVDTLNRSALRAFAPDAPRLPALDAFSAESVRFADALSPASWTLPSHASLLTGLYPDRHGAITQYNGMDASIPTLAETLSERGYQTVAFTDGGFLDPVFGLSRGFERYDGAARDPAGPALALPDAGSPPEVRGADLFARAIAFLPQRDPERPLFLFLQTYSVHDYFRARPWALQAIGADPRAAEPDSLECLTGSRACSDEAWTLLENLYRAEIEHLDRGFGRLLTALNEAGVAQRAVILVLSDHGEGFDVAAGRIHHGGRLHADLLRVPLLVRLPGGVARDVTARVSLVDVAPTILELAGAPQSESDGLSFAPLLRGNASSAERPLYAMEHQYRWSDRGQRIEVKVMPDRPLAMAVVSGPSWYIRDGWNDELYDMQSDADQQRNRSAGDANLDAYRKLMGARSRHTAPVNPVTPDAALVEQLRALGYGE